MENWLRVPMKHPQSPLDTVDAVINLDNFCMATPGQMVGETVFTTVTGMQLTTRLNYSDFAQILTSKFVKAPEGLKGE